MKKILVLLALLGTLLVGYVAAGPYLAYTAIRDAVETSNTAKLARHVDFPVLRGNLKAQLEDYMIRRAGPQMQADLLGSFAVRAASGVAGAAIDMMVTPAGVAALLEGRSVGHRLTGDTGSDPWRPTPPANPLRNPHYRFESTSRFSATIDSDDGEGSVQLVLSREGLRWKLTDIRLGDTRLSAPAQDAMPRP